MQLNVVQFCILQKREQRARSNTGMSSERSIFVQVLNILCFISLTSLFMTVIYLIYMNDLSQSNKEDTFGLIDLIC